jgi:hypothetical protein
MLNFLQKANSGPFVDAQFLTKGQLSFDASDLLSIEPERPVVTANSQNRQSKGRQIQASLLSTHLRAYILQKVSFTGWI